MSETNIKLRVVFMGTSELSEVILQSLINDGYNLVGVFTKPDMKVGRKQQTVSPRVKVLAQQHNIEVFQPLKFNKDAIAQLDALKPDIVIVAAYGKIIPKSALEIPGFGCINVHVSLLPKFRGPSPIQNALLLGEENTGITIMLMDEGIDTGDILAQQTVAIDPQDNAGTLTEKLSTLGAQLLSETLPSWIERKIQPTPQDNTKATLCQLIEREDGHISWMDTAEEIYNRYRAFTPWPGIFSYMKNSSGAIRIKLISIKLQKTNPLEKRSEGEIFELGDDIGVQCSEGVIILKEIQKEGKKAMNAKEFSNGHQNFIGSVLF